MTRTDPIAGLEPDHIYEPLAAVDVLAVENCIEDRLSEPDRQSTLPAGVPAIPTASDDIPGTRVHPMPAQAIWGRLEWRGNSPGALGLAQKTMVAMLETMPGHAARMAVIVYNRRRSRVTPEMIDALIAECPDLVSFKDGTCNIDIVRCVTARMGERLSYIGALPTLELFEQAYRSASMPTYSSVVSDFVPGTAIEFHRPFTSGDDATFELLICQFYYPFAAIRVRKKGYAVSGIKFRVPLRGILVGRRRAPVTDLTGEDGEMLGALIGGRP